ncbi:hypothetical protein PFV2_gp19 [Pyrobaculum filamentous virus 2]|uniref:Uncharacterized protein n=1 Tax=Pyrobaculum filamentous virus 2 TaxID=2730621 RepID=A0A6M3VYU2_PFV2|nr:hypothetical protein QIT34_gp19 [Pyrobaculum filamentous virus 2]QJF12392.1 hypothetical protein PFV2_gp19 [Pyrobaculum filamentous virus 2]
MIVYVEPEGRKYFEKYAEDGCRPIRGLYRCVVDSYRVFWDADELIEQSVRFYGYVGDVAYLDDAESYAVWLINEEEVSVPEELVDVFFSHRVVNNWNVYIFTITKEVSYRVLMVWDILRGYDIYSFGIGYIFMSRRIFT